MFSEAALQISVCVFQDCRDDMQIENVLDFFLLIEYLHSQLNVH